MLIGYLATIIVEMLLAADVVGLFLHVIMKRDNESVVNLGGYFWLVIFVSGFLSTSLMIRNAATHNDSLAFVFAGLVWLCIILAIKRVRKVIFYDDQGFILRKKIFWRQHYGYGEITAVVQREVDTILYMGTKYVILHHISENEVEFLDYVLWNYRKMHGENPPAEDNLITGDIFHGHVTNVGEAMTFYILLSLFILGLPFYLLYDAHQIITEDETEYFELRVTDYKVRENGIVLISDDYDDYFFVSFSEKYGDQMNELLKAIQDRKILYVNVVLSNQRGDTSYTVYNMKDESGKVYLTYDEVNRRFQKNWTKAFPMVLAFSGVCFLWVIKSFMVTRNPEKYSQWTRDIFDLKI